LEIDVEPVWHSSADGSRLVRDAPGVTVDTSGIPLRHRSAVSYPSELFARGVEGTVSADLILDWEGHVEGVHVLSGPVELAKHVIASVADWHYAEHVGRDKPRRVTVDFSLAGAKHPPASDSAGDAPAAERWLLDDVNSINEFWTSFDYRGHYTLKKLAICGISEDDTDRLMEFYRQSKLREGGEFSTSTMASLIGPATNFDRDLRVHLIREGSQVSLTIAPKRFFGNPPESPAIQTRRYPPGEDPEQVEVSASDQAGKLISKVAPEYPIGAKMSYIQGVVRVALVIGKDGRVLNAGPVGPPALRQAAESAVKQWVYAPTLLNDRAVEVISETYVDFFLPY
jgi:hypothetical protein